MRNTGDEFNFHSPASGVFGSQQNVIGNTFGAHGLTGDEFSALVSAIDELLSDPSLREHAENLEAVRGEIVSAQSPSSLRAALGKASQVAIGIGQVAAPLLEIADRVRQLVTGP